MTSAALVTSATGHGPFGPFVDEVRTLVRMARAQSLDDHTRGMIDLALDGRAAVALRELLPLSLRRANGIFFTDRSLADDLIAPLVPTFTTKSVVLDPACGAGNLLLACLPHLPMSDGGSVEWRARVRGWDVNTDFVQATRLRLVLAVSRWGLGSESSERRLPPPAQAFRNIVRRSALTAGRAYASASHVVLNPPFHMMQAPPRCEWADGSVNAAAVFVAYAVKSARPGTIIRAILPDVLRSGSRYRSWRSFIDKRTVRDNVNVIGSFDTHTDVDVFFLSLVVGSPPAVCSRSSWLDRESDDGSVRDSFDVVVGSVVPHRHVETGRSVRFLRSGSLPSSLTTGAILARRRYSGRLNRPPFVVVPRTSGPGERPRARATVVTGSDLVAVENHLLVLSPRDAKVRACHALARMLRDPATSVWLDKRIRCRHLTVDAVSEIPLPTELR